MSQSRTERRARERAELKIAGSARSASPDVKQKPKAAWYGLILAGLIGVLAGVGGSRLFSGHPAGMTAKTELALAATTQPSLSELCEMSDEALNQVDVGYINLLCSKGLPGSGKNTLQQNLDMLDRMTVAVREQTTRNMHRWLEKTSEYENSEAYFKVGMMVSVLAQDFGVQYKSDKISAATMESLQDMSFFDDADDVFITGCLGQARAGTCSSMPVLAVALGRRLGYPLKLVGAKAHLFFRWEDGHEKRNFEYTNGVVCSPDDYYRKWPFPITDWEEKQGWYLRSLTPQQELSIFLNARGVVLQRHRKYGQALVANAQATVLWPGNRDQGMFLASSAEAHLREMGFHRVSDERAPASSSPYDIPDPGAESRRIMEFNRRNAARLQSTPISSQPSSGLPRSPR